MHFVMTPVGSSGDVHPYIGIGRALRARGHDVVIVTSGAFEQVVERAGLGFRETISAEIFDVMSKHPDLWNSTKGLKFVLGTVAQYLRLGYERVAEVYEPGRTVLVGHALSFGTRLFEEKHGVPSATLHLAPSIFRSDFQQPAFAPGRELTRAPRWFKRMFWWGVDAVFRGQVTAIAVPVVFKTNPTWGQLLSRTWSVVGAQTWGSLVSDSAAVETVRQTEGSEAMRKFVKFRKSLRFRQIYFRLVFETDGSLSTAPVRLFSLMTYVRPHERVSKTTT